METHLKHIQEAADFIRSKATLQPTIALICGTGLGGLADAMDVAGSLSYADIPHYPVSTVESHKGQLVWGTWGGREIFAMQGRFHLYEGYEPVQIAFPMRVLAALGVKTLLISSAAGGLDPGWEAGDLMLITDHINLTGHNPLRGPNADAIGPRFPDMNEPWSRRLQKRLVETALEERIPLRQGVYVGVLGPSLETAAETRMLKLIGADAVGMSTVMENIAAVHAGMEVAGICVIANVNRPDCFDPIPIELVIANAESAGPKLMKLYEKFLEGLDHPSA